MTRILAIEDDAITAKEIVTELSSHGLEVDWSTMAVTAWRVQ